MPKRFISPSNCNGRSEVVSLMSHSYLRFKLAFKYTMKMPLLQSLLSMAFANTNGFAEAKKPQQTSHSLSYIPKGPP